MPAEHAEPLAAAYRAALAGEQRTMEYALDEQTYRMRFVPVSVADGRIIAGMAVTEDTSEQTRAERQIRQSEAQLRHIGQMAKIGGWSLDLATMTPSWSDETCCIHALDPGAQPSVERTLAFFPPAARAASADMRTWASQNAAPWDLELPIITAKGQQIWVRAQGEIEARQGVVVGVRGTLQDITERKQLEEALRERDLIYTTLFQVLPIGVSIVNADGQITDVNPASERLLGLSRDEHRQRRLDSAAWQVIRPDGSMMPSDEYAGVRAMREQRLITDVEIGVVRAAGETTWLSVTATPMPLSGYGVVVVYSDITQRTVMDQTLRRTLAERETMLKEIHHRVKNNLQVVVSLLRLQGRQLHDVAATAALRESRQRVEVMAFVHELLYQADDLALINASTYVQQLSRHLAHIYTTHPEQIDLQVTATDFWLSLDQAIPCGLIIHELLSNSFKYAFPDGRRGVIGITLACEVPEQITLRIWDTGVGLPGAEPGLRRPSLGMQLVHDLVRQLRGTIMVDGSAGTRITIAFPAHAPPPPQRATLGTGKVLL
jgi:PAS domain S-box-containing protein